MIRKITATAFLLVLVGCRSFKIDCLDKIDASEKTICMAPGNGRVLGDIKHALRKDGWKIFALSRRTMETRGSETSLQDGSVQTKEESRIIEKSRYRLCLYHRGFSAFNEIGWPELSIIDNRTCEEVILVSYDGRVSCADVVEAFMDVIHKHTSTP